MVWAKNKPGATQGFERERERESQARWAQKADLGSDPQAPSQKLNFS